MYKDGQGVPKDYFKAVAWYREAANQGDAYASPLSQTLLGQIYEEGGYGVPQDYVQAYKWYDIGAAHKTFDVENGCSPTDNGCPAAVQRDSLAAKMTQAQINEGQQLAREWKPTPAPVAAFQTPPPAPVPVGDAPTTFAAAMAMPPSPTPNLTPVAPGAPQSSGTLPDALVQWKDATREHCDARHTRLGCSQYYHDANACMAGANNATVIIQSERNLMHGGATPQQAARAAAEQGGYVDIAALALRAPATMTPREFSNWLMKDCLEGIDQ